MATRKSRERHNDGCLEKGPSQGKFWDYKERACVLEYLIRQVIKWHLGNAMRLSQEAKSNYYKGLLVLIRRDRLIHAREKDLMLQFGEILGFDRRFCETAIDELLSNANITRDPVFFSDEIIKECFFHDAVRLALIDGSFHPSELRWLRKVARFNGLTDQWLDAVIREIREKKPVQGSSPFEIQQYL
jgi:hypothetical protein